MKSHLISTFMEQKGKLRPGEVRPESRSVIKVVARLGLEPSHCQSHRHRPSVPVATFSNDSADFVGPLCRTPLGQTAVWGALLRALGDILNGTLLVTI